MATFVLAFDVYGTLLDTSGIAQALSDKLHLDEGKASEVSALWRRYQLEYTWRLNSMAIYEPFDVVTRKSLRHALKESRIAFDDAVVKDLMDAYNILPCYPETLPAMEKLFTNKDVEIIVFSNGTKSMVQTALEAAHLSHITQEIYVSDSVRCYKPAPELYNGLIQAVGKKSNPEDCLLISGNPFDVAGALAQGMRAIWVDRTRKGWTDSLLPFCSPDEFARMDVVHDLGQIPELVASFL